MVGSAKQAGSHMLDQAKNQAVSYINEQRQTIASGIETVSHAFQEMGKDLREKDPGPIGKYGAELGQALGGQAEQLATYLRNRDVHQLVTKTEDFARRSPTLFLGSAFVLGLAASRFLKGSRSQSAGGPAKSPNPGPSTPGAQFALPPASLQAAASGSNMPVGFPFEPREPLDARPAASPTPTASLPAKPAGA